jgi:ankyrin repeat protein
MAIHFNSRDILWACRQGDIRLVKFLIKKGFNPFKETKDDNNNYIIPIDFYGSSNRNITEVGKNNHIKKIKKFMFKYEFTKGIEEIFFASDIERLLSPQITA